MRFSLAFVALVPLASCTANPRPGILPGPTVDAGAMRDEVRGAVDAGAQLDADPVSLDMQPLPEATNPCETRFPAVSLPMRAPTPWSGGFVPNAAVEARLAGTPSIPFTGGPDSLSSSLLADLNSDGRTDMVFNDHRDFCGGSQPTARSWILWQDDAGALQAPTSLGDLRNCQLAADLDGDGRVDLVCSSDRGWQVRWNGPDGLSEVGQTGLSVPGAVMATTAWDLDDDGALDLVFANWNGPSVVLRNLRGRAFEDVTARWALDASGQAWTAAFVDFDEDGTRELFIPEEGAAHENRAFRDARGAASDEPRLERFRPTEPACDTAGLFATSNEAPMGVALGDIDRNGSPEFILAAGWPLRVLSRRRAAPSNWNDIYSRLGIDRATTTTGNFLVPWSPVLWDMDHDGVLDLWVANGDDQGFAMGMNRGQSATLVYRGRADATFTEVSREVGVDRPGQYCHVQLGDLDHDGDLDVVLGRFGAPALVLENRLAPVGRHTLLSLRGSVSNPEGRGAMVTVSTPAHAYPMGDHFPPWAAPQPEIDLALGADPTTDRLRVRWPSGCTQTVTGPLTTPRQEVSEPAWLTLTPPRYHQPAGTDATVTVTVFPALLGLETMTPARIDIDDVTGAARWMGPVTAAADGSFQRTLRAAATPGSVSLRVTVDGRALPARPRLWFDRP